PLSGPSQPGPPPPPSSPSGPPSGGGPGGTGGYGGSGGPGGGDGPAQGSGEGPGHPWWRSVPKVATIAVALVAAVVLTIVLTRPDGSGKGGEVVLQAAGSTGPDPYTESTARESSPPPTPPAPPSTTPTPANATRSVAGSAPGLYGGTRNVATCDVEKQITALTADPAKNKAFASVQGIAPAAVPGYLRSLTPVQLQMDTRVTNHGYKNGAPTSYQAVLQAGTAVLVDNRGVPRVRCACGNPLLPMVPQQGTPKPTGDSWPGFRQSNVVVVRPSVTVVNVFIMYDPRNGDWFSRQRGDEGADDEKTEPPPNVIKPPPSPNT
ncbi:DUF6777 domain-containing protein, partial [Streptomyces lunaelactis]